MKQRQFNTLDTSLENIKKQFCWRPQENSGFAKAKPAKLKNDSSSENFKKRKLWIEKLKSPTLTETQTIKCTQLQPRMSASFVLWNFRWRAFQPLARIWSKQAKLPPSPAILFECLFNYVNPVEDRTNTWKSVEHPGNASSLQGFTRFLIKRLQLPGVQENCLR